MTLVIHHNDLDGECSAAIVGKALGYDNIIFFSTTYDKPLPPNDLIIDNDIVIVDFSYKPTEMVELQDKCKSIIWIDHHRTAMFYPYDHIPGIRDFKDKSMAACELTWMWYFPHTKIPLIVRHIGDYDKWAHNMVGSKSFHEGAKLYYTSPDNALIWNDWLYHNITHQDIICKQVIDQGNLIVLYKDKQNKKLCDSFGYETFFHKPAYAVNQSMFSSLGFGSKIKKYPICISYVFDGFKYIVSLYSEQVDVSEIAKMYGGGGHKGAAGFTCSKLPFERIYNDKAI